MKNLYIKQKVFKITDHYPVLDEEEKVHYYVDEDFRFFGLSVHISDPKGTVLCHIEKKIIALLPTFYLHFSNGLELEMRSRFTFLRQVIDVGPSRLGMTIEGNIMDHDFSVFMGNRKIGHIHKKFLSWGDTYHLEIEEEEYELLFIAMVVAVDHIIDERQSSSSANIQS